MLKQQLLDKFFGIRGNLDHEKALTRENGDLLCAYDCDNGIFFIQMWLDDGPIVSYECSLEDKTWEFCAWAGCNNDSQKLLNQTICEVFIRRIRKASANKNFKVKTIQLSLF